MPSVLSNLLGPAQSQPALVPVSPAAPPTMRNFGDATATRKAIYDGVFKAFSDLKPVTNQRYQLELGDLAYEDPEDYPISHQKKAILQGQTMHRRLRGNWRLKTPDGNVVDEKRMTLAQVPYMTPRGTFILGGNEYTLAHQMRLRPGIFHRVKENGELEAHVNVMPGKGLSHRYFLEPETGIYKVSIGQSQVPLLPLLRAMGVSNKELRAAWGQELLAANMAKDDPRVVDKLYMRLVKKADPKASTDDKRQALANAMSSMEFDPEVTRRTLGRDFGKLDKEAILESTKKLLAISRGESDTDDRDHLAYQTFMGPEDLISERVKRSGQLLNQMLWKSTYKGNLDHVQPGAMTKSLQGAILDSGLGQPLEEINPADVFDQQSRVSRLGYGGIPSMDAVPDEARNVQPSHLNYVDLLRTPECYDADTDIFTLSGWKKWPEVTDDDRFACLIDDRLEFHKPEKLIVKDYQGLLHGVKTTTLEYLVTPEHRLYVRPMHDGSAWRIETPEEMGSKSRIHRTGGHQSWLGESVETQFTLPDVERLGNNTNTVPPILVRDWAEFMGWYLSEGHCTLIPEKGYYVAGISQSQAVNPENCQRIEQLLNRLPFAWSYNKSMKAYMLSGKQLATYCKQFGFCNDKFIPDILLRSDVISRQALYDALLLGDGRVKPGTNRRYQYCSTSRRLAEDFQRLAFSLGIPSRISTEVDKRKDTYLPVYVVNLHDRTEREIHQRNRFTVSYSGKVYCAWVPGGLLYVRRGATAGHWSGNSFKVGVDSRLSFSSRKGSDGKIYSQFIDPSTGQLSWKSPQEVADAVVAFPGEMEKDKKLVAALINGRTRYVTRDKVNLAMPHFENAFSPLTNVVPLKSTIKGQRVAMGSRFITQALPLENAESPLVQAGMPGPDGKSFEEHYGQHMGAVFARGDGRVAEVTPDNITVKYADGTTTEHALYNNFPYNRKTYLHNTATVQPGDPVKSGQPLARSNYTDKNGTMALGLNMRIAYVPFRGLNYEDAYVISESAAKRLSSEHMYQQTAQWEKTVRRGKNSYVSIFPAKYDKNLLKQMDDDGIIQPGTKVNFGDPLVLIAQERPMSHKQVHAAHKGSFADHTVTWDHHSEGVVTDVAKTNKGVAVAVRALSPTKIGDKIAGRYGDKGVISAVIADNEMPHGADGKPYEVLANPLGVISRTNPGQVIEAALGKVAAATGKPYKVLDWDKIDDMVEYARGELDKHGLKDTEDLTDPVNGRKIPGVLTGNRFIMKLHHTSESKGQGRGLGSYTSEEMPARGGEEGSKRLAMMDVNALLSHGATEVLRDAKLIRGQKNQEYWSAFMSGSRPPTPKVPLVYDKFVNQLKAAGVNVVRQGGQTHIMAMTDKDVERMTEGRELQNAETVDWKGGMKPKTGGLFDPTLTGGHGGNRWSFIKLAEPMPSPVMEEPIRRLLGLTQKQYEQVLAGREKLGNSTGPDAIKRALSTINVDQALVQARADIQSGRRTARDAAVRRLGYLKSAQKTGIHPSEWVISRVPVLPPIFRPVSIMQQSGNQLISDANYLYKEVFDSNQGLKDITGKLEDVGDERLNLYKSVKAVVGLGDPVQPKNQERKVQGMLQQIFGWSPKLGTVQQKLLGTSVDLVGRAVVTPNPDLTMDEVGLPEGRAWEVYTPFIVRRLVRRGVGRVQALEYVKNRNSIAKSALLEEMGDRPVMVTRAPVLHRYGELAFWPKLTKGDVLQVNPTIVGGFGMDFDGDAANYHLPASDEAREETIAKMLPSKNLMSVSQFKAHYLPRQEYVGGLWAATAQVDTKKRPRTFATAQDALRAFYNGELGADQQIEIMND